jgi:predicted nucleic acid-binding Zn ribbon protein
VIPVQDVMPAAVAEIIRKAPLTAEKLGFAWRSAVGPAVANVTAIELRDQVLHVSAKDPVWLREVERSATLIRSRLAAYLGEGTVRYIQIGG